MNRIMVRNLKPGMKVKDGGKLRTVTGIEVRVIDEDYTIYTVFLDGSYYVPGRGRIPLHASMEPDDTITVYE